MFLNGIDVFSDQIEIVKPVLPSFKKGKLISNLKDFIGTHFINHGSFILLHGERLVRPTLQNTQAALKDGD